MKSVRTILYAAALLGGTAIQATPAFAQATRTWVSGVGDDVNPCSRTAPCKTFAGAISKTANGGEINCLDPAGYGAVTINKSLTIDCHFTEGGVLAGGNGIVVNATPTDVITLRGLDIFGVNPPTHGVRILVASRVIIEDCTIRQFNSANSFGISFQPSGLTNLYVHNTTITNNGSGVTGGGVQLQPTGTGSARVVMQGIHVVGNNNNGILVDTSGTSGFVGFALDNSDVTNNSGSGVTTNASGPIAGFITNSLIFANLQSGISSGGANSGIKVGNTTIAGNASAGGMGVNLAGGAVRSYNDNRLDDNGNDGAFTGTIGKH